MNNTQQRAKKTSAPSPNGHPTIGFLNASGLEFFHQAWRGVADVAREHNVNAISFVGQYVRDTKGFKAQANILYNLIDADQLDGLIIQNLMCNLLDADETKAFYEHYRPLPIVSLGRLSMEGYPYVQSSGYKGMHQAIVHLIEVHGRRRIAFVKGLPNYRPHDERYQAYIDVLTEYGLPFDPARVAVPLDAAEVERPDWGQVALRRLLDEQNADIDALVTNDDRYAHNLLPDLQARGLRVPDDIALVSFDDEEGSHCLTPPLTTVPIPIYEMGRQAAETLLAQLEGQKVLDQAIDVPSDRLIVRQSCGCLAPKVAQVAAGPMAKIETAKPLEASLAGQRERIVAEMVRASENAVAGFAPGWAEQLLDGFVAALTTDMDKEASARFLSTLDGILRQVVAAEGDIEVWPQVLSTLRRHLLPYLSLDEDGTLSRDRVEDLWLQAQAMIGEVAQRAQACRELQAERRKRILSEIGTALVSNFDVNTLADILARELPRLGISRGYLALYEDSQSYQYPQPAPEWSRLVLAYDEENPAGSSRVALDPGGRRFPSRQLVPEDILPQHGGYDLVVRALYFHDEQIGFMVLDGGQQEGAIYDMLHAQISSALQGDLLVQHVRENAAEIARHQYVLDTFMDNVPDSIYFKDRDSRFTQINQALGQLLGLAQPDEAIGKSDFDFFSEEQAQPKYDQEQQIIQTGQSVTFEEPDSGGRWALTTKMPLRDEHGNIIGTFGISRDISSLKQMQTDLRRAYDEMEQRVEERTGELRQLNTYLQQEIQEHRKTEVSLQVSEQQYRLLADQMAEGLVIVRERTPVFVNTAFAALVEDSPERILQKDVTTWFPLPARALVAERLTLHETETPVSGWQTEFIGGSDRLLWVEIEQRSIVWDNQPAQLLTVRDITEQKRRETHLEQERARLQEVNVSLKSTIGERFRFGSLVGKSPAMQRVYELIISAATSDVNALLVGESGTGKELIARTIHQVSARKSQAFVPVNCASIPETLFEREFFGHRKGSFTGADRNQSGLFDRAHKGTLFLDEVTELSPGTQAKLLRVLQDGEYLPLGSTTPKQADVLIVAATNKPYDSLVRQNVLREDFFYRICVIEIQVPPLRDRKEDIPLLIEHFLNLYHHKQQQREPDGSPVFPIVPGQILETLYAYDWPGNIRELSNVLQRYLATHHLDRVLPLIAPPGGRRVISENLADALPPNLSEAVKAYEKRIIAAALEQHQHNVNQTAESLDVPFSTLYRKAKKYQLL